MQAVVRTFSFIWIFTKVTNITVITNITNITAYGFFTCGLSRCRGSGAL